MNKKITPHTIKIISIQAALVIVAVTAVGGAALIHSEYKNSSPSENPSQAVAVDSSTAISKESKIPEKEEPTSSAPEENREYEYGYAGFYPKTTVMYDDYSKIIVNGDYCLPEGYVPSLSEAVEGSDVYLDSNVAPYYQAMYDAAKKDGITLTPVSGYRSIEHQKRNFEARIQNNMDEGMDKTEATIEAAKVIMVPGASEHNAGLAMDICSLSDSFEYSDEFAWLQENAADYGFILRYPKDEAKKAITKVVYEPWHYRYVGIDAAKEIKAKGITLEEYLGLA